MVNRFTTARSTVIMRRWGSPAIVTLAVMAALTALTADAAARQAGPNPPPQAPAPREEWRRADHGDRVYQDPAGHFLRRRRLDHARAGIDRHHGTRDASRNLRRPGEGQGPPLDHV